MFNGDNDEEKRLKTLNKVGGKERKATVMFNFLSERDEEEEERAGTMIFKEKSQSVVEVSDSTSLLSSASKREFMAELKARLD